MQVGILERKWEALRHFFTIKLFKQIFSQTHCGTNCSKQYQIVGAKTEKKKQNKTKKRFKKIGYEKL